MRLHVVSCPHTQTVRSVPHCVCAFTQKVVKFSTMMHARGHEVILYSGEDNEADCTEHVVAISKLDQEMTMGHHDWWQKQRIVDVSWGWGEPHWRLFNARLTRLIGERWRKGDILCLIQGTPHLPLIDAFQGELVVEYGVGYEGVAAPYRAFESYAWMHTIYGFQQGAARANGIFTDAVIPNYFEAEAFPAGDGQGDYLLSVCRLVERKGIHLAAAAAQRAGMRYVVLGDGPDLPAYGELMGNVGPAERARWMGGARALLMPVIYVEPFGGVHAEAQMCGTPVITTDWGVFTETVSEGESGFRCRTDEDFDMAIERAALLDRAAIRERALSLWSTDAVAPQFERWFERLIDHHHGPARPVILSGSGAPGD